MESCSMYAGNSTHALFDLVVKVREPRILLVADRSWLDREKKHAVLVEAHIQFVRLTRVRRNSPAPTSRTSESAIWETISALANGL